MRKLIWLGIVLGLVPLYMGSACGGYFGWPGLTTSGGDAKITQEVSVGDPGQLDNGLWTYYANYNNVGGQHMKSVSTYRDGTAPFGLFTTDGNLEQHYNDHVGVITSAAYDANGDGVVDFNDYNILDGFCPSVGGTGGSSASSGFKAYCSKGLWEVLVAGSFNEETKQSTPGSKYSNAIGNGSNFTPITLGQVLASSQLIPGNAGGIVVTVNGATLPNGASHTLSVPASANVYGFGHGIAIDATQSGLKELASWLASQWAGQPDRTIPVTFSFNGGKAQGTVKIAGGNSASLILNHYAAQ
jgi:hypothetical protein